MPRTEIGNGRESPETATFVGGSKGSWKVLSSQTVKGPPLERVARLDISAGHLFKPPAGSKWLLRGITSNERYTTRSEHDELVSRQPNLGRREATIAALIPIRKSSAWWTLSQDERRAIFETKSGHIKKGLTFLPAIARRLYHCRDLGEPFDFLTWFEYSSSNERTFDELVARLRETEEWTFVEREVDIRLVRNRTYSSK